MWNQTMKEKLQTYKAAGVELRLMEEERGLRCRVRDWVKGSMTEHPYLMRTISITGDEVPSREGLNGRREELLALREDVERFLAMLRDPHMAMLLWLRYVKGLPWRRVADKMGGRNTENSLKQAAHRFLEKIGGEWNGPACGGCLEKRNQISYTEEQ